MISTYPYCNALHFSGYFIYSMSVEFLNAQSIRSMVGSWTKYINYVQKGIFSAPFVYLFVWLSACMLLRLSEFACLYVCLCLCFCMCTALCVHLFMISLSVYMSIRAYVRMCTVCPLRKVSLYVRVRVCLRISMHWAVQCVSVSMPVCVCMSV